MNISSSQCRYIGSNCNPHWHFFKITNAEEKHRNFQYNDGLNVLQGEFSIEGSCVSGGLYFTTAFHIYEYLSYGIYLRDITLPADDPDLKMVEDPSKGKWRANKIILGTKYDMSRIETHEYLLSKGAPEKCAYEQMIKIAKNEKNLDLAKYLLTKPNIKPKKVHKAMLKIVLKEKNPVLAQSLTDFGVSENKVQCILFKIMIAKENWDTVKKLIQDIPTFDEGDTKPIIKSGDIDLIIRVIERGFVFWSGYKNLIFDLAIKKESMDLVKLCIQKGYYNEIQALREVVKKGNIEIFKILVENGMSFKADTENLFGIACVNGHTDMVKYLVENGTYIHKNIIHDAFTESIINGQIEIATFLITRGAMVCCYNDTLIMAAVEKNSLQTVKFLVENGVNFKISDEKPLRLASEKGYLDIVKYLVEKGSNVRVKNNDAICLAVSNNHVEMAKFLYSQGAKIHTRNDFLIKTAIEKGYISMIIFLREISPDSHHFVQSCPRETD